MFGLYNTPQSQLERWTKIKQDAENEINRLTQPQAAINQNFNIVAPTQNDFDAKFIDSYEQVKKQDVSRNTIFMNTNEPVFYMKMTDGEIKSYRFEEIKILDEKDKKILELEKKIDLLMKEGVSNNGKSYIKHDEQPTIEQSSDSNDVFEESATNGSKHDKKKS